MTQLNPFSPPFTVGKQQECGCYIDVDGVPHLASWTGEWAVNDFSNTSRLSNFQLSPLKLSPEITSLWRSSKLLGFGTDACIRSEGTDSYPIIKIARPSDKGRQRTEREFRIMRSLSNISAVARVASEPLIDGDGIFGFRLERLDKVSHEELKNRRQEVEDLLKTLHRAGYCHGDCSFSNIMQNKEGRLVLIDLAFAGTLGRKAYDDAPKFMFPEGLFTEEVDWRAVNFWSRLGD
jgi:hypothetical protein